MADDLAGRVFLWTFNDGPTAGTTYEHTFRDDGTVIFRDARDRDNKQMADANASGSKYASFKIAPNTYLVSYLSAHGYTLTVSMNLSSKELYGFASGSNDWHPLRGTVEEAG